MEDKDLRSKIKTNFDAEVPDLLSKIKADPSFRVPPKSKGFSLGSLLNRRMVLSLTSLIVVAILIFTVSSRTSNVVASTVILEVNPSIEITLNSKDIVINVTALNDDGDEVIEYDIEYRGLTIDEVLEILVLRLNELGYVVTTADENNIILIEVESKSEALKTRLEIAFQTKLQSELGKYSDSHWVLNTKSLDFTTMQKRQISNSDLLDTYSVAKVALAYKINELDDSYTLEELVELQVRDLYDIYIELESPSNLPDSDEMPPSRNQYQRNNYNPYQGNFTTELF